MSVTQKGQLERLRREFTELRNRNLCESVRVTNRKMRRSMERDMQARREVRQTLKRLEGV